MAHRHLKADLTMLRLPTTSNMPSIGEDEVAGDADEPPDDYHLFKRLPAHRVHDPYDSPTSPALHLDRRESLLTRALMSSPDYSPEATEFPGFGNTISTRPPIHSARSAASIPSTAELTSDGGMTSPERSNTPSPPPPTTTLPSTISIKGHSQPSHVVIADGSKAPTQAPPTGNHESVVEANLGRKRCITFACGRKATEQQAVQKVEETKPAEPEPPKRKCMLTFACPSRALQTKAPMKQQSRRHPSPAPVPTRKPSVDSHSSLSRKSSLASDAVESKDFEKSEKTRFHEFAVSHKEEDEWVNESTEEKPKITVNDCMKKEMAIRKIGEEAEEEARMDEEAEEEAEQDADDDDILGFSDGSSDDGNESDNEEGFADSDEESDVGSDYHFWAPSTTTAATSTDQLEHIRTNPHRSASETSLESIVNKGRVPIFQVPSGISKRRAERLPKFRPGTPDLPDSTDFVCGTLDEDRPLEAAYMSCLEQRRRSKHVPIPQDIDPSFPTSDPEAKDDDDDDDDDEGDDGEEPLWIGRQMEGIDDHTARGRRRKSTDRTFKSDSQSPRRFHSPSPKQAIKHRSPPPKQAIKHRSPPPKQAIKHRSPPPTKRIRSPAPPLRLKSPPPTQRTKFAFEPTHQAPAVRITGRNRGCELVRTNSLPRTPNPFFVRQQRHRGNSDPEATSPKTTLPQRRLSGHTRGPIDIVEGLEKKRQKRREKFWRQNCRKAAKEQQERKPMHGKGVERMKELGLEVAERAKGYGLGQQAQLVLSI